MSLSTLLVDDDRTFSALAAAALEREFFQVTVARSLHQARRALETAEPDLVLLDHRLPDGSGVGFLPELRAHAPAAPVVMVTAYGDVDVAVAAMRTGASDYVAKPVELTDLVLRVRRIAAECRLRERLHQAEAELSRRHRLLPGRGGCDGCAGDDPHRHAQ